MKKHERRLRHGELITRAWNPEINGSKSGLITIGDDRIELRALNIKPDLIGAMKEHEPGVQRFRAYRLGEDIRIIASIDDTKHGRMLHLSVSRLDRLPSWTEMIAIKRHFYPDDVCAVMVAPEEEVYVNIQTFTLHWWQLPEKWGIG